MLNQTTRTRKALDKDMKMKITKRYDDDGKKIYQRRPVSLDHFNDHLGVKTGVRKNIKERLE